ncbi:MAG TPA: LysR family transcriptional regulator [Rhizobacter sp.]|nr:LysR family transcriptional regulator [Rhizobacter sp.]
MNDLDPLWLRSFVAVADTGSVTRAAQKVHRTQSAVSTHLQQLEASLGVRLAERSTRSLALTAEGERFLPHARRLLDWQMDARAAVQPAVAEPVCRVGISEYFMPARLGEMLALLHESTPGRRFELLWTSSAALLQLWQAGTMDLAVVTSNEPLPDARLIKREPLAWVHAERYAVPERGPAPLVLLGPECPVRRMALDALAGAGRAHHLRLSCTGAHGAMAALRAGWGIGCLNQSAVPGDLVPLSASHRWPAPGRLSFYSLTRPALQTTERELRRWAQA